MLRTTDAATIPLGLMDVHERPIHVSKSTFKGGVVKPVHRWFRLTPSFGPDLVRTMLRHLDHGAGERVLDPFAGRGTTLIECQILGIEAVGVEINPFLSWVTESSLYWDIRTAAIDDALGWLEDNFRQRKEVTNIDSVLNDASRLPPIHNATRWWRPDVLRDLVVLKESIAGLPADPHVRRILSLALAGVLVPQLTNVTLGRLQFAFITRDNDEIDVLGTFVRQVRMLQADLSDVQRRGLTQTASVITGDCTSPDGLDGIGQVDLVITSPPYPNRYSYVWNTRPYLYLFEFFTTPIEAAALDKKTIGGTWGTATSVLAKGEVEPLNDVVARVVGPRVADIRRHDDLMANYAMKYFNDLARHLMSLKPHLTEHARLAYVVGWSRLRGVTVETDELLGGLIEGLDLQMRVESLTRFRQRHSDVGLHESVVYARRR